MSHEMFMRCFHVGEINKKKSWVNAIWFWLIMFAYVNSFKDRRYYFFNMRNYRFKNMDTRVEGNNE